MKTNDITPKKSSSEETELKTDSGTAKVQDGTNNPIWQSVLIGGIPGILIGASGTIAVEAIAKPNHEENPTPEPEPAPNPIVEDTVVLVATSVNDEMSFSEAFAAARAEVGPGGAFVWHGGVYGTYRGDDPEWQEMTVEQRAEHSQLIMSQVHRVPYTAEEHSSETHTLSNNDNHYSEGLTEQGEGEIHTETEDVDASIHILSVGEGFTEDGDTYVVGHGNINGHEATLFDNDNDGIVDAVLVDNNDNQIIEEDEVYEEGPGIGMTVEQMLNEVEANSAHIEDDNHSIGMADYTNDADTGSFA